MNGPDGGDSEMLPVVSTPQLVSEHSSVVRVSLRARPIEMTAAPRVTRRAAYPYFGLVWDYSGSGGQ